MDSESLLPELSTPWCAEAAPVCISELYLEIETSVSAIQEAMQISGGHRCFLAPGHNFSNVEGKAVNRRILYLTASEPNLAASALESNGYASQHHGETDTGECVSKHLQVIGLVFLAYRDRVIDNTPLNMDDKAFIASQTTRIQAARRCRFSPLRDEG